MDGRVAEIGTERGGQGWPLAALVALCALLNVAPVLGWVTGLAQFSTWFVRCSLPALVVLVAIALVSTRRRGPAFDRVRRGITLGTPRPGAGGSGAGPRLHPHRPRRRRRRLPHALAQSARRGAVLTLSPARRPRARMA